MLILIEQIDLSSKRIECWVKLSYIYLIDVEFLLLTIGWRGKLCMVNVKGKAAKEGVVYDVQTDIWEEMPKEMLAGWQGPAAAMEEDTIYTVDESKGALRKYDPGRDKWVAMLESEMLKGAQQMAAGGGRVCVVRGDGVSIVVVDVVAPPYRFWIVDTPPGLQAITINILPRLSP